VSIDLRESRWTAPRPDCPHPERWHSTDADSTEIEVSELVGAFVRALQPDLVVETGAAWGQTSAYIGEALLANGQGTLVTCDPDPDRVEATTERCKGLPVIVLAATSLEMIESIHSPVGFAWFDSLIELRVPEFRALLPNLASGTIVAFHDTGPHFDLRPMIEILAQEQLLRIIHLATPRGVIFGEVL
jgi:predicted O-methyltransferase YrrM